MLDAILKREGGYVNDPADPGGPTKFGITLATLTEWRGGHATTGDVADLDEREARAILRYRYLEAPGISHIGWDSVRAAVLDAAVNHGPQQAIRSLQRCVGVKEDGIMGPVTLDALAGLTERAALAKLAAERVRLYGRIIQAKPGEAKFASGWLNRAAEFVEALA